jgi:hypothetical protein
MSRENNEAAELKHAEEVSFLMFPAADQSAKVVKPSEEALDFPAAAVTTQFAAVLGALSTAIVLVGRDESDAVFWQRALVERITVVGAVADHSSPSIGPSFRSEHRFENRPLGVGQIHAMDLPRFALSFNPSVG